MNIWDRLLSAGIAVLMLLFVITNIQCTRKLQQLDRDIAEMERSLNIMNQRAYIYGNWASLEEYQGLEVKG